MKIILANIGKAHDAEYVGLINEFTNRINKYIETEWMIINSDQAFLEKVKSDDYFILLDERGKELDNNNFVKLIEQVYNSGKKRLIFLIGGAYGVNDNVKSRADLTMSFSKLVFPHMLMRIILAEQLYRAHTIMKGEKYHHE